MGEKNLIIGLEFGKKESQLCVYDRKEADAVSVPVKLGCAQSAFATCLSKKCGEAQWHFGPEAQYFTQQQGEILVEELYEACLLGMDKTVDGKVFEPGELLAVFIRQALHLAGVTDIPEQMAGLTITTERITRELVEAVRKASAVLKLPANRCFLQNYEESFYYYTLYQKPELYSRKVGLFVFGDDRVKFWKLEMNARVKPTLVRIEKMPDTELPEENELRDKEFGRYAQKALGVDVYSTIFLVGEGFDRSWSRESLLFLSRHKRRVFMGNNLYVKGACFSAREKVEERTLKGYLFISEDVVRMNIGMDMLINGAMAHYSLIPAVLTGMRRCGRRSFFLTVQMSWNSRRAGWRTGKQTVTVWRFRVFQSVRQGQPD